MNLRLDPYANHVMRKVAQCLTGFVQESGQTGTQQQHQPGGRQEKPGRRKTTMNDTLFGERTRNRKNEEIFSDFYTRFLTWPQFFDLFGSELTSGLVQVVLKTGARVDPEAMQISSADGIQRVCKALGDEINLTNDTHANLYTRLLEVCLSLENDEMWSHIFKKYFARRLENFGVHEKGKFSLKKIIETCPSKEEFEVIFDELHPNLEKLYKADSTSPFVSLAIACKKFGTRQAQFVQSLTDILTQDGEKTKVEEEDNFILKLARFGGKLELKEDGTPKYLTQFVGTMITQNLMDFHKPLKATSSLLEMEATSLIKLTMDPKGSHIIDAFFKSSTIGEKNKEKLLNKFKEYMHSLAMNKFGSRVVDTMWAWGSLKHKTVITSSLVDRVAQLGASPSGKFIVEKCNVHGFKRDAKVWAESIEKGDKRQTEAENVLSELLGTGDDNIEEKVGKRKKRDKKNKEDKIKVEEHEEPAQEEEVSKKKSKKDKKKIKLAEEQAEVSEQVTDQLEEEGAKKKKKKSKRDKTSSGVEEQGDQEMMTTEIDQEDEVETKPKKKKKSKRSHDEVEEQQIVTTTATNDDIASEEPERKKKKKKANK